MEQSAQHSLACSWVLGAHRGMPEVPFCCSPAWPGCCMRLAEATHLSEGWAPAQAVQSQLEAAIYTALFPKPRHLWHAHALLAHVQTNEPQLRACTPSKAVVDGNPAPAPARHNSALFKGVMVRIRERRLASPSVSTTVKLSPKSLNTRAKTPRASA